MIPGHLMHSCYFIMSELDAGSLYVVRRHDGLQQIYGEEFSAPELVEPLKSVLLGRTFERPSVRGLLASARIYCSVYDPVSGKYRLDYSMFASAIPALMVLGMLAGGIVMAGRRNR